jgi:hypothetical protein
VLMIWDACDLGVLGFGSDDRAALGPQAGCEQIKVGGWPADAGRASAAAAAAAIRRRRRRRGRGNSADRRWGCETPPPSPRPSPKRAGNASRHRPKRQTREHAEMTRMPSSRGEAHTLVKGTRS